VDLNISTEMGLLGVNSTTLAANTTQCCLQKGVKSALDSCSKFGLLGYVIGVVGTQRQ
jgi:hypothetical protein